MNQSTHNLDERCRFRESHEWVRLVSGREYEVGLTPHGENALGDVVFVELPAVGATFTQGAAFGVIESVKAASELYMPISGRVSAINSALVDNPSLVNQGSWTSGWIIRIEASVPDEWDSLLDASAYAALLSENGAD